MFKTVLADDGKDVAAGSQAAVVTLRFVDAREAQKVILEQYGWLGARVARA